MKKGIVLSSGGVDSTTCISLAIKELGRENVSTLSFYYGQKHSKELECARKIAKFFDIPHKEIDLSKAGIFDGSNCSLLNSSGVDVPEESYAEQIAKNGEGMVSTYVPFRNGLMLSTLAAVAMSIYPEDTVYVYLGAHADDAAGNAYADCSLEFVEAMSKAIRIGTYEKVLVQVPFVNSTKAGVVKKGLELGTPYALTWSCYKGGEKPCGKCGTCIDRAKAFEENGVIDPALNYKED